MHGYMRSIGFRNIGRSEMSAIFHDAMRHPDSSDTALDSEGYEYTELRKEVVSGMGIAFRGTFDENDRFVMDYYFPYRQANALSTYIEVEMVKESDRESFLGICEEPRLGVDLVFFVQDMMVVLESEQRNTQKVDFGGVRLSALASSGKILLPIERTEQVKAVGKEASTRRQELVAAARVGDQGAFEQLTLDDMDIYNSIARRIGNEDVLSLVNTYFMPNGIESDKYSVLGEIMDIKKILNHYTMEALFIMTLNCNDVVFEVCINERDLLGEPAIGRRFKGDIWMQGRVRA
ncbi:MAG: DUF3881 family protein [Lachnospiraceae bacterium]|nr:DUF3881 family protein [Lachnospiraceae bacterium]